MPPLDPASFTSGGAVHGAWMYPLFDAILQHRARRFPLGATMPGQEQAFVSPHAPLPLPPVEEALLILAGTGVTGLALRDLPFVDNAGDTLRGNTMLQFARRVYASACGAHGTELFYTNDIYTTYGRFPAQLDAMHMCMWLQAHHLETDYYDRFMQPGAYHDAIANHMHVWHTG